MTHASRKTQLELPEGVLLGHALVARLADSLGLRVFFIKGPASVIQGLREAKVSADVDVFADPPRLDELLQALRERGWRQRPADPDIKTYPRHSVTVYHPDWPCCLDIHFRFPGMEEPALDCFDVMWANSDNLDLMGQKVHVPSKALGILILALHALRTPELPACRRELEFLGQVTLQGMYAPAIQEIAEVTGSLAAVRPFLEELLDRGRVPTWPMPSDEWRNRLSAREPGSARLLAILQAPPLEKVRMLWRAVFPATEVFLGANIYADMTFSGKIVQHWDRWRLFLRALPRTVRDIRNL